MTFEYGITPLHRFRTIFFALLAIALCLFVLEAPNALADLSVLNTLGFVTLVTSIGGLAEVVFAVLRHRTGHNRIILSRRATQIVTGLAWVVFGAALIVLSAADVQTLVKNMLWLVILLAGFSGLGEGCQLYLDLLSHRRFERQAAEPLIKMVPAIPPRASHTKSIIPAPRRQSMKTLTDVIQEIARTITRR